MSRGEPPCTVRTCAAKEGVGCGTASVANGSAQHTHTHPLTHTHRLSIASTRQLHQPLTLWAAKVDRATFRVQYSHGMSVFGHTSKVCVLKAIALTDAPHSHVTFRSGHVCRAHARTSVSSNIINSNDPSHVIHFFETHNGHTAIRGHLTSCEWGKVIQGHWGQRRAHLLMKLRARGSWYQHLTAQCAVLVRR